MTFVALALGFPESVKHVPVAEKPVLQGQSQKDLTLKAPITTRAEDSFCDIFPNFRKK